VGFFHSYNQQKENMHEPMIPLRLDMTPHGVSVNHAISTINEFNAIHNAYENSVAACNMVTGIVIAGIIFKVVKCAVECYEIKKMFKDDEKEIEQLWKEIELEREKNTTPFQRSYEAYLKVATH
jgi:hypothetical protein